MLPLYRIHGKFHMTSCYRMFQSRAHVNGFFKLISSLQMHSLLSQSLWLVCFAVYGSHLSLAYHHSRIRLHCRVLRCWREAYAWLELGVESIPKSQPEISEKFEAAGPSPVLRFKMGFLTCLQYIVHSSFFSKSMYRVQTFVQAGLNVVNSAVLPRRCNYQVRPAFIHPELISHRVLQPKVLSKACVHRYTIRSSTTSPSNAN